MPERARVLLVSAGARGTGTVLDEEQRSITEGLEAGQFGGAVELVTRSAARPADLVSALLRHRPAVLHLSGRGKPQSGLLFRAEDGGEVPIDIAGLAQLLRSFAPPLRLVILTACWTAETATLIGDTVGCAIGIDGVVSDRTAAAFSRLLYTAIGNGYSVGHARQIAVAAMHMYGADDHHVFTIDHPVHVDPEHLFVLPSSAIHAGRPDPSKPHADTTLPLLTKTVVAVIDVNIRQHEVAEIWVKDSLQALGEIRRLTIRDR